MVRLLAGRILVNDMIQATPVRAFRLGTLRRTREGQSMKTIKALVFAVFCGNSLPAMQPSDPQPIPVLEVALLDAAANGKTEKCKLVIKDGADLFVVDFAGHEALWRAMARKHEQTADLLVEKMLALPSAAQKQRIYAFLFCLKNIDRYNYHNFCDIFKKHLQELIKYENKPEVSYRVWRFPGYDFAKKLMKKYFAPEWKLRSAVYVYDTCDIIRAKALLNNGAHPDGFIDTGKRNLLMALLTDRACNKDAQKEACKLLIQAGANIHRVDEHGRTALMQAALWGYWEICKLLIDRNADVNHVSFESDGHSSALMNAASSGRIEIAQLLLEAGADPYHVGESGRSVLRWGIASSNFVPISQMLVEHMLKISPVARVREEIQKLPCEEVNRKARMNLVRLCELKERQSK